MKNLSQLAACASTQLGLFLRGQAHQLGVNDKQLQRLTRTGVIQRLSRRVFRFTSSAPTWHQHALAACLDGGPDCLASHRTAAALHHFDGFAPGGVIEVVTPIAVRLRRKDVIAHRTRDLPTIDRCRVGVIPATTPARTLIDLGASMPATRVEEAFDSAERNRVVRRAQVQRRYDALRAPGRNGVGAMTQVLSVREPARRVPRSVLERRMFAVLERAGLPLPTKRYKVRLFDGVVVELDFAFVSVKLGIEVDGHGAHATRAQRAADNDRANAIGDAGWRLRRFTFEQVMLDEFAVANAVRQALVTAGYDL